jgi:glutamate racemase
VKKSLPHERIIYLGDTARVPYGNRSPATVTRYSLENTLFLVNKGIKLLIVACNTSSAVALPVLKKSLPIPVIGVIDPPSKEAVRRTRSGRIGVIGTRATILSEAYRTAIRKLDPSVEVISRACPLFVPIVKRGSRKTKSRGLPVREVPGGFPGDSGIDVLVLGCTPLSILERQIMEFLGKGIYIVNTGRGTSREVAEVLNRLDDARETGKGGCALLRHRRPGQAFRPRIRVWVNL